MRAVLALLSHLTDDDTAWLFANSAEVELSLGEVLIAEGKHPDALFIVLSGLLDVRVAGLGNDPIDSSGPGELLGEMSFLEDQPATATVSAAEPTTVLRLARPHLARKLDEDPRFAARLYRAFARTISARHRQGLSRHADAPRAAEGGSDNPLSASLEALWQPLAVYVDGFKELVRNADIEALADKNGQRVSEMTRAAIFKQFRSMSQALTDGVSNRAELQQSIRDELGARIKRELLPFMLLTSTTERFYAKPRGYAGDFLTIDSVYHERVAGSGRLGEVLDACVVVHEPASKAVRNRRHLIADEIVRSVEAMDADRPYRVTALASGPAAEIFDAFERIGDPARLQVTLIDIDPQALDLVRTRIAIYPGLDQRIRTEHANLVYLALGRQKLDLAEQDFVYSMGLIDYLKEKFVLRVLDYIHRLLRPGGRVLLGNFHPRTGTRALMDYVFDWKLIFRTEADMRRMYQASPFSGCTRIVYEDEGVDMFAEAVKSIAAMPPAS